MRDTLGDDFSITLTAGIHALTPVPTSRIVTSLLGRRLGYVVVKDMISQANAPLETAFAQFRAAGVSEVVLDLRYNGGGLVSVGGTVASYVAGSRGSGRDYARLLYNDQLASEQQPELPLHQPGLGRGRVACLRADRARAPARPASRSSTACAASASQVVAIGDTTCGKPVGFLPASACGTTYSAVNFESVNDRNEGRYFDGFAPTCAVAEDFTQELGSDTDPLLLAAADHSDFGACPATGLAKPLALKAKKLRGRIEAGERQGMIGR